MAPPLCIRSCALIFGGLSDLWAYDRMHGDLKMTREQIRNIANEKLGAIVRISRLLADKEISMVAKELGTTEIEVLRIEESPAEVPCCDLFRLLSHYGPIAKYNASLAWLELSLQFRECPKGNDPTKFLR